MKLTKTKAEALGKVFSKEIGGGPVPLLQSRARVFKELEADGLVVEDEIRLGGRFPMTCRGWGLTHAGRLVYCQWASTQESPA